ncbi:hypothetical protein LIER_40706 [Lithospermum erythrorhizon]|uniref:Uncharacterized protein n=1 Tax=Lithospermum erythrorhizon TaxID=34254 RepID=A0AAV3R1M2_LITER
METGSTSKKTVELGDRNVCTLQVPEEIPKKGMLHEEIQSVPFDEKEPAKVFIIRGGLIGGGPPVVRGPPLQARRAKEEDLLGGKGRGHLGRGGETSRGKFHPGAQQDMADVYGIH